MIEWLVTFWGRYSFDIIIIERYLLMMGVDEILESDLKLFKTASKEIALIFYLPDFESRLLCLLFKRLNFLFSHVIKIVFVNSSRTVHERGGHGLLVWCGWVSQWHHSNGQCIFALFILINDGVDKCNDMIVVMGGL